MTLEKGLRRGERRREYKIQSHERNEQRWRRRRTDDVDEGGRGRMRIRKFQFLLNHSRVKKSREPRLSFNLADTSAKCVYCIGEGGGREREERGWDFWPSPISGWDANLFSTSSRKRRDDWKREGEGMKISATSAKKKNAFSSETLQ